MGPSRATELLADVLVELRDGLEGGGVDVAGIATSKWRARRRSWQADPQIHDMVVTRAEAGVLHAMAQGRSLEPKWARRNGTVVGAQNGQP